MPEVTAPRWFEAQTYFNNKLAEMQLDNPGYTAEELQAAFDAGGFTGDDGLYRHFQEYGNTIQENLSPNAWFDVSYYMEQKLAQMQQTDPNYTMVQLVQVFNNANLTAWDHYTGWGMYEGINPSNVFNTDDYMNAKLEQMRIDNPEYTMEQLDAAFRAGELNPIMHWFGWGDNEHLSYTPGAAVVTTELTTGIDKIEPSPDNIVLDGTVTSPSKNSTLNSGDQIDGGDGADVLNVSLGAAFNGFSGDGFMKNFETVNITNTTKSGNAVNFKATGIDGTDTYNVTGNVNLSNIAAGAGINLIDYSAANATIGFATSEIENLNLGVNNVAGAKDAAVNVKIAGVDKLTVNATGDDASIINLGDTKNTLTDLTVSGSADLKITGVDADLEALDASEATGKLDINATAATALNVGKEVSLGAGDDKLTLGAAVDTTIDGGAGTDEVVLTGASAALVSELTLTNVETLTIAKNTGSGTVTFSGANSSGIETVQLDTIGANVTLAEFTDDYTLQLKGANKATILAADAETVTMVMGDGEGTKDTSLEGALTAAKAESVILTVNTDVDLSKTFKVTANQATDLTITSNVQGTDLNLSTSSFDALQNALLTSYNGINLGTVAGESTSVSIDANGVKGANGLSTTIAAYTGTEDGTDATVVGSNLGANNVTINSGYDTVSFTGGLATDNITIGIEDKANIDITVNTGVGVDDLNFTQTGSAESITLSGNLGGDGETISDTLIGVTVDASEFSGYTSLTLQAVDGKSSTLVGGSGKDTLNGADTAFAVATTVPADTSGQAGYAKFNIELGKIANITALEWDRDGDAAGASPAFAAVSQSGWQITETSITGMAAATNAWSVTASNAPVSGVETITIAYTANATHSDIGDATLKFYDNYDNLITSLTGTAVTVGDAGNKASVKFDITVADVANAAKVMFDADGSSTAQSDVEIFTTAGFTSAAILSDIKDAIDTLTGFSATTATIATGGALVTQAEITVKEDAAGATTAIENGALLELGTGASAGSFAADSAALSSVTGTDAFLATVLPNSGAATNAGVTDTLTGGAGDDVFVIGYATNKLVSAVAAQITGLGATTIITDFDQVGDDKLSWGASVASSAVAVNTDTTDFTMATFITAAFESGKTVFAGQIGDDAYVAHFASGALDALVQLTGVNVEDLTNTDLGIS